jgi:hypothetical protein
VAQREFAELVDGVMADAEDVRGGGFGQCVVGLLWCAALWQGAVGSGGVVALAEGAEQGLQLVDVGGAGSWGQPAFEGLVEAFDLALGLGVSGVTVFLGDAQTGRQALEVVVAVSES